MVLHSRVTGPFTCGSVVRKAGSELRPLRKRALPWLSPWSHVPEQIRNVLVKHLTNSGEKVWQVAGGDQMAESPAACRLCRSQVCGVES